MGVLNPRAICPNCGGKIHTQAGRTGRECQFCGVALTGKVGAVSNRGQLADRDPGLWDGDDRPAAERLEEWKHIKPRGVMFAPFNAVETAKLKAAAQRDKIVNRLTGSSEPSLPPIGTEHVDTQTGATGDVFERGVIAEKTVRALVPRGFQVGRSAGIESLVGTLQRHELPVLVAPCTIEERPTSIGRHWFIVPTPDRLLVIRDDGSEIVELKWHEIVSTDPADPALIDVTNLNGRSTFTVVLRDGRLMSLRTERRQGPELATAILRRRRGLSVS
jgi:hypothetical protein